MPGSRRADDDERWPGLFGDNYADVAGAESRECGAGRLVAYSERAQIPALSDRLASLRNRLDA